MTRHASVTTNHSSLQTAGIFLSRFYHEEPNDDLANLNAIKTMCGHFDYEWQVSSAFKDILATSWPAGTLKNLVRVWANRHAQSDKEAVQFLWRVYENTGLDVAIDFDEFADNVPVYTNERENGGSLEIPSLIGIPSRIPSSPQLAAPVG